MTKTIDRRHFMQTAVASAALAAGAGKLAAREKKGPKLKKAVKFDMIRINGSIADKFELIKSLGFVGVEVNSPGNLNREEAVKARDKTGIAVHGVIDSIHWQVRL